MVIDLLIHKTDDGFNAEVPSVKGCETWAAKEDDAIDKAVTLLKYYLKLKEEHKIKVDKARIQGMTIIYKLVFNKT